MQRVPPESTSSFSFHHARRTNVGVRHDHGPIRLRTTFVVLGARRHRRLATHGPSTCPNLYYLLRFWSATGPLEIQTKLLFPREFGPRFFSMRFLGQPRCLSPALAACAHPGQPSAGWPLLSALQQLPRSIPPPSSRVAALHTSPGLTR